MSATIVHGLVAGFESLTLQNGIVRAVVLPSLGGRVWELEDCRRGRQWIWHRPGVPLAATAPGDAYDDVWAGGWEELFPNDAPGPFDGRALPDHGEWWALPWTVVERPRQEFRGGGGGGGRDNNRGDNRGPGGPRGGHGGPPRRDRDQHPPPSGPPAGKFLAAGKISLGELLLAKLKEQEGK